MIKMRPIPKYISLILISIATPFMARLIGALLMTNARYLWDYFDSIISIFILFGSAFIGIAIIIIYDLLFRFNIIKKADWSFRYIILTLCYLTVFFFLHLLIPPNPFIQIAWFTISLFSSLVAVVMSFFLTCFVNLYRLLKMHL